LSKLSTKLSSSASQSGSLLQSVSGSSVGSAAGRVLSPAGLVESEPFLFRLQNEDGDVDEGLVQHRKRSELLLPKEQDDVGVLALLPKSRPATIGHQTVLAVPSWARGGKNTSRRCTEALAGPTCTLE
jgi:hypothetical protein